MKPRFNVGDKATIVNELKCLQLDKRYCSRYGHSFMADKEVTISSRFLIQELSVFYVYTIEEAQGYFWEEEYFI